MIHNDYRLDNVVLDPGDPLRIMGVLDWEMATIGDPLMDLGETLAYWIEAGEPPEMQAGRMSPTNSPGAPTRAEVVESYASKTGLNVDHLDFYYCFGLFRLAVIVQQIYYRYYKGQSHDLRFGMFGHPWLGRSGCAWKLFATQSCDDWRAFNLEFSICKLLSRPDSRPFVLPRSGLFQLRCHPEQGRFIPILADELDADRQVFLIPEQWHGHGGLAGDVGDSGVGTERTAARPADPGVVRCRVEGSERHRRLSQSRGEPQVEVATPVGQLAGEPLQTLDRVQIVGPGKGEPSLIERPRQRLVHLG